MRVVNVNSWLNLVSKPCSIGSPPSSRARGAMPSFVHDGINEAQLCCPERAAHKLLPSVNKGIFQFAGVIVLIQDRDFGSCVGCWDQVERRLFTLAAALH